jgi:hypothetical protein
MSDVWFITIGFMSWMTICWLYWMRKASREHLQVRNASYHLKLQNEIIARRWQLRQLEAMEQQESH